MRKIMFGVAFLFSFFAALVFSKTVSAQHAETMQGHSNKQQRISHTYDVPEFYYHLPKRNKDTTWKFECYDSRDSIMNMDTVNSINEVRFFSLFKSYTDSAHTYKDANGQKQLLPVSSIIQRYDKVGKDKWVSINYTNNKYTTLKEFRQDIVRVDTIELTDPVEAQDIEEIYRYYKVEVVK